MSLLKKITSLFCKKTSADSDEPNPQQAHPEKATEKKSCCHSASADKATDSVPSETSTCHSAPAKPAPPVAEVKTETPHPAPEPQAAKPKPDAIKPAQPAAPAVAKSNAVPEDVVLKRHFIATIKSEVESNMPPCPSDSALKRHYAAQVQAEIERLTQ